MVPRWVPFKIMSDNPTHHSKWLLLLKIDISSIVHIGFKHQRENKQNSDNTYVDFNFLLSQDRGCQIERKKEGSTKENGWQMLD